MKNEDILNEIQEKECDEMRKQMQDEEMQEEMMAEENAEIIREIQAEEELRATNQEGVNK